MNPQDEFEKMDDSMLKTFRPLREQKFSKAEMDDFHAKVMKQIADRPIPQAGFPYAGLVTAAAFSAAVIFAAAFYFHQLQVPPHQEAPVKAKVVRTIPIPEIPAPQISVPAPVVIAEEDLLAEIEALKELGVWTEEDEEEAGIPVEAAFLELARYAEDFQQPSPAAPPSSRA